VLALLAVAGLIASFHAIIFAYGRQIFSLSRAGYFPHFLSLTHGKHRTPNIALIVGSLLGLAVMLVVWFNMAREAAALTVIIALVTIGFQLTDPVYGTGVIGVAIWYALAILYFAVYGRNTLVLSPEEEVAMQHREGPASSE
jgi:ethanolamine permease